MSEAGAAEIHLDEQSWRLNIYERRRLFQKLSKLCYACLNLVFVVVSPRAISPNHRIELSP